jgi:hypothetical protein
MEISEAEVRELVDIAAGRASRAVGINASHNVGAQDVIDTIRSSDKALAEALDRFVRAYARWFEFHTRRDADGQQTMTGAEQIELMQHIQSRDETRTAFRAELARAEAGV